MSHPFTTCSSHDVLLPAADNSVDNSAETFNVSPNATTGTAVNVEAMSRFKSIDALPSPMIDGLKLVVTFKPSTWKLLPLTVV